MSISGFQDEYRFLSNFYPAPVEYEGEAYPTAEHAFQAAKAVNEEDKEKIRLAEDPKEAKEIGRKISLRSDWEEIKKDLMHEIVLNKFKQNDNLRAKLLKTEDQELIEENNWGDTYWGVSGGEGKNHLGRILMRVRAELR